MRNRKPLLKKGYLKKESLRRELSFLLSLCMVASLFGGVAAFPAFAQEPEQTQPQEEIQAEPRAETPEELHAESREEIKARLLRQIREEGWDPYSADMSLDEFYALMELFQEGTLPLEDGDPAVAMLSAAKPGVDEPGIEAPDIDGPDDGESDDENQGDNENQDDDKSDNEKPGGDEKLGGDQSGNDEEPGNDEPGNENPDMGEPDGEEPGSDAAGIEDPGIEEPNTEEPGTDQTTGDRIPRNMFLFSGVYAKETTDKDGKPIPVSEPGRDADGYEYGSPLEYDNDNGHIKKSDEAEDDDEDDGEGDGEDEAEILAEDDYMAGLDSRLLGYTRPPMGWPGVKLTDEMKALVIVPNINADKPKIASDVDQSLFLHYEGYYVYRVTAQNNDVTVLGAIPVGGSYVYYYTNYLLQDITVSATTLPEGHKFVIEYQPNEYTIEYKMLMAGDENDSTGASGDNVTREQIIKWIQAKWTDSSVPYPEANISDVTAKWEKEVYGTYLPTESELGAYAFTAKAPDGYTLSFYMVKGDEEKDNGWGDPTLQLATKKETTDWQNDSTADATWQTIHGLYTFVNNGWALGEEPVYDVKGNDGFKIISDNNKSPEYLTLNGTFYNNTLDANRLIVAVLRKKADPVFNAATILKESDGAANRGTTAKYKITAKNTETGKDDEILYDYEDVYLWATDQTDKRDSEMRKYEYYQNSNSLGGASYGNIQGGNIATADSWNWSGKQDIAENKSSMDFDEETGTYSFQWTFQTNSDGGNDFLLDVLEINRVGIKIPFYAKYSEVNKENDTHGEYRDNNEKDTGLYAWSTTTPLTDGAVVTVEFLMLFKTNPQLQRVYRITVTGAKNNVTITALNLMMYGGGAPEFSTYDLDGITGATSNSTSDLRLSAIQHYGDNGWGENADYDTSRNTNRGNVVVDQGGNGIDYGNGSGLDGGDETIGRANFRFKLADGYGNPYYLYESARHGVISGALSPDDLQASVVRNTATGEVIRSTRHDVVPYISNGDDPYMAYYDKDKYEDYKNGTLTEFPFVHPPKPDSPQSDKDDFVNAEPIPVALVGDERKPLYDEAGNLYTDWGMIQVSTDNAGNEILYPTLYYRDGDTGDLVKALKDDVIVDWDGDDGFCFSAEDGALLKSNYIYRGAASHHKGAKPDREDDSYWYYIRVSGQGKWNDDGTAYQEYRGHNTLSYKMALLTIVAYPMRYMIRYKPYPIPEYKNDKGEVLIGPRDPVDMPKWDHNHDGKPDSAELNDSDCPAFPPGHEHNPDKPHDQFEDDEGNFYNVESNYDVAIVPTKPRDPAGYHEFLGWRLVDENDQPVRAHVFDENGHWLKDENDEYITTTVTFYSGSFDLRNYAEFAIENENMGGDNTDIYVLRLIPVWEGIDAPYHYNVALNWVDVNGEAHMEYFDEYWPEIVTSFAPGEDKNNLVVKILTESTPFRNWLAQNGTYAFWDEINNAEDNEVVENALKAYYKARVSGYDDESVFEGDPKFEAALKNLKKMSGKSNTSNDPEFERTGNYTYAILDDSGTIIIWMEEIYGTLEFHKEVEAEPFTYNDEYYFTVEQILPEQNDGSSVEPLSGTYYAYPDVEDVLAKDGWEVEFTDGKITNIKQYDDSVAWPEEPVTYFTLHGGEGITLYVPEGEYAIRELGSKSGGSYQAVVEYVDNTNPKNNAGADWKIPESEGEFLWLKGSEKEYLEGTTNESISQISATGKLLAGEANAVHTINFHNRTSTVAFEKTVTGPYNAGDQFGFQVTLKLPKDASPLYDEDGNYYFNFNLYDVEYYGNETPGDKPENADPDWRPDGTLYPVTTGRMVVVEKDATDSDGSTTTWVSKSLLVERRVWNDAAQKYVDQWVERRNNSGTSSGIWIEAGQRFYVVCTVLQQGGINYTITETEPGNNYRLTTGLPDRDGTARAAEVAYVRFVNTMLMILPTTGGFGGKAFLASGAVFVLSGLGLAWLNRDLWGKRAISIQKGCVGI